MHGRGMGMGMGMALWEWEGMGVWKAFPHTSTLDHSQNQGLTSLTVQAVCCPLDTNRYGSASVSPASVLASVCWSVQYVVCPVCILMTQLFRLWPTRCIFCSGCSDNLTRSGLESHVYNDVYLPTSFWPMLPYTSRPSFMSGSNI